MRIEIIRQPLHADYADILQNYVLLQVLKHMWHEVWTIIQKKDWLDWADEAWRIFFVKKVMIMSEELYDKLQRAYTKVPLSSIIRADIEPY